jgi:hypothetical protein
MVEVVAIVVDNDDDATLAASSRCTVIHNNICLSQRSRTRMEDGVVSSREAVRPSVP